MGVTALVNFRAWLYLALLNPALNPWDFGLVAEFAEGAFA